MLKQNRFNKLLEDYSISLQKLKESYVNYKKSVDTLHNSISDNSLASVEPEPLAKNKDSESKCDYCNGSGLDPNNKTLYYKPCPRCS